MDTQDRDAIQGAGKSPVTANDTEEKPIPSHDATGLAVVDQGRIIPTTGQRKITTSREFWSYCFYACGGTGTGIFNYGGAFMQLLVSQAHPAGVFQWGGSQKSVSTFVLDINGIIFAVQLAVLLLIGPYADYGTWRPWILIFWTVVGIACSFAFFGIYHPDQWALATGFYVTANVANNIVRAYYAGAFPGLVRDLPKLVESEREVLQGTRSPAEHARLDVVERSKLSNLSTIFSSVGCCLTILLSYAIVYGVGYQTVAQNTRIYSLVIGYFGAIWLLTSLPWFLFEQHRPGQSLPDNTTWLTVGPKQVWEACRNAARLKQTFLWLAGYFLIADCYNTSATMVNVLQNEAIRFDIVTFSGLFAMVYGLEFFCIVANQYIQLKFDVQPKWMFFAAACGIVFTNLWGLIGIWTHKIGYHNVWEFWFYQACIGVATTGWYSYGQTIMSEVSPAPKMYIFFALYNTLGKTAAFIGPFITSAIIKDANNNTNVGFSFTLATGIVGLVLVSLVDTDKAKRDNMLYLEKERRDMYASHGEAGQGPRQESPSEKKDVAV